jgi:hypothetical protein
VQSKPIYTEVDKDRVEALLAAVKPFLSIEDYTILEESLTTLIRLQNTPIAKRAFAEQKKST